MLAVMMSLALTAFAQDPSPKPRILNPLDGFLRRPTVRTDGPIASPEELETLRKAFRASSRPNRVIDLFLKQRARTDGSWANLLDDQLPPAAQDEIVTAVRPLLATRPFSGRMTDDDVRMALRKLIDSNFREGFRLTLGAAQGLPPAPVAPGSVAEWTQSMRAAQEWLDFHKQRLEERLKHLHTTAANPHASGTEQTHAKPLARTLDIKLQRISQTRDFVRMENAGQIGTWGSFRHDLQEAVRQKRLGHDDVWQNVLSELRWIALQECVRRGLKAFHLSGKRPVPYDRTEAFAYGVLNAIEHDAYLHAVTARDWEQLGPELTSALKDAQHHPAWVVYLRQFLERLDLEIGKPDELPKLQDLFKIEVATERSFIARLPVPQYQGSTVSCLSQCVAAATQAQAPGPALGRLSARNSHARAIWGDAPDLEHYRTHPFREKAPTLDEVARVLERGLVAEHHQPWLNNMGLISDPSPFDALVPHWDSDPYRVRGTLSWTALPVAEAVAQIDTLIREAGNARPWMFPIVGTPARYTTQEDWLNIEPGPWQTEHVLMIVGEGRGFDPISGTFQDYYLVQNNLNPHEFFQRLPKQRLRDDAQATIEVAWITDVSVFKEFDRTDLRNKR